MKSLIINPVKIIIVPLLAAVLTGCAPRSGGVTEQPSEEHTAEICESAECGAFSEETTPADIPEQSFTEIPLTEKSYSGEQLSEEYFKLLGRTHNEEGILWLPHSASGAEFVMNGSRCSVTLAGDSKAGTDSSARFAAYVNGERVVDEMISEEETTLEIFVSEGFDMYETLEADTEVRTVRTVISPKTESVTIRLMKLSEAAYSTIGIKSVDVTARGDISPTAESGLKIEFIGDSLTCGYGVDDEVSSHHFSTSTEDATKAFAYKTAQLLGADHSLVAYSGFGVISGYTSVKGVKSGGLMVPDMYEMLAYSAGSYNGYRTMNTEWDFPRFRPDVVVITLGANDYTYTGDIEELTAEYSAAYTEFLKQVRGHNPDAYIVCCLGLVSDGLFDAVCAAAELYTEETGDGRISALRFPVQDGSKGYAADYHPTAATYDEAAELLAEKISSILDNGQ